ncbi:o-succinylbenzoate synthase [Sinomonas cyclohexanicum]|uniref:o-succinylbenzoate synthase n=1 Tax=Sinomonas cyclohexanicum TaxID=322009 RepID=A0ABM7PYC9_SINCY|nr:o-succinylbenzoate synthase [Corynebacterium cyclohexanicum]BCT77312.1 o-succinylbenzoate synthase [Corynebacterium cyclohexanicum]
MSTAPTPALPDLSELEASIAVVRLPMTVRFRGVTEREALLLRGPAGWGEFSPFLEYDDAEASRWLASGIEAAWEGFPEPVRARVPVNATVPAVPAGQVRDVLAAFGPVQAVKVKVAERGQSLADDVARVAAVRDALPEADLRVDANAGWSVAEAVEALSRLGEFSLEYAEQPVPGINGLAEVRALLEARGTPVRIAADEAVRKADDPLRVARARAADLIIVKAAPLGGVRRALEIVREAGLPAVVSSALDTSVGLAAGVALAAALPSLPHACGLGTGALFAHDVVRPPLVPDGGSLPADSLMERATPDPELLERFAAPADRRQWWLERLRRCHAVLAGAARHS